VHANQNGGLESVSFIVQQVKFQEFDHFIAYLEYLTSCFMF